MINLRCDNVRYNLVGSCILMCEVLDDTVVWYDIKTNTLNSHKFSEQLKLNSYFSDPFNPTVEEMFVLGMDTGYDITEPLNKIKEFIEQNKDTEEFKRRCYEII